MPEQFSPHEWRTLDIPFAPDARAYFHACRTARWFAPFFARTFDVPAYGYHWYTTVSLRPDRFRWERLSRRAETPGLHPRLPRPQVARALGSLAKYVTGPAETMKRFDPHPPEGDPTYDSVADLYDEVFEDITVREDEWRWLQRASRASRCACWTSAAATARSCCSSASAWPAAPAWTRRRG
jgi:hypothetical protein